MRASPRSNDTADRLETLQQAWAIALAVDQGLEARRWNVSSAQRRLQAAKAQRWPNASVEGAYHVRSNEPAFRVDSPSIPLPMTGFPFAQSENLAFRTEVALPLYTGGRIQHGSQAAAAAVTAAVSEVETSVLDLKMLVAATYVAVLRAQRDLEVALSTVISLEAHLQDAEMLFAHHQVPRTDLLAAQVALADARQGVIQAQTYLDINRATYNRHLDRPLTAAVRIAELPLDAAEHDVEALTARALCARPEIARLAAEAAALRHRAKSKLAENGVQFELRGEYTYEENRFRAPEGIAAAAVGAQWNLFDAGRNRHEAAALDYQAESLLRLRADLKSRVALQVHQAWLDVQQAHRRLDVTAKAIHQAEESFRVIEKRYAVGSAINTQVLDAQTARAEACRNHQNATYDAILAVLRLQYAAGELGE